MKHILVALACLLVSAGAAPTLAGDMASLEVIGYSKDGRVFAFEEYGIQDGSGFAYSNVYFIDTGKDAFLPSTPVRAEPRDERPLSVVRRDARQRASALIEKYRLEDNPGVLLAYNPPSELGSDPHDLRFRSWTTAQSPDQDNSLVLAERELPAPARCANMTGSYKGFVLKLKQLRGVGTDAVLREDASVPASRRCPNAYRIGAVISSETSSVPMIAMILVGSFGFEGNDWRWIAVPVDPHGG